MLWWDKEKYNRIGRVYGRLTVVEEVDKINHSRRYKCLCICGQYTEVSANNLVTGKVVSCGCALKGCNRQRPFQWLYTRLMTTEQVGVRGTDISYEDFIGYTDIKKCHYCDVDITWTEYSANKGKFCGGVNLDRKDSNRGYFKDNCVVCCKRCNRGKSDLFTYDEWVEIGKVIKSFAQTKP